jgi:hypothetical protein
MCAAKWYSYGMAALAKTNLFLRDRDAVERLIAANARESSAFEGVHVRVPLANRPRSTAVLKKSTKGR